MKNFILKFVIFLCVPLALIFLLILADTLNSKNKSKLPVNITTLYVGDSHPASAISDSLLIDSKNFSDLSETYFYSYYKLKLLLDSNPQIKKVFVGFSYHNLSTFNDKSTKHYFSVSKYFKLLPLKEKLRSTGWNLNNKLFLIRKIIQTSINDIIFTPSFLTKNRLTYNVDTAHKEITDKRIVEIYYTKNELKRISNLNILYFFKIKKLLEEQNIILICLNNPLSPYHYSKVPEEYINYYTEFVRENNLTVIDFQYLDLKEDKYFMPDGDHVSNIAVPIIAKELNRISLEN